MVAPLPTWRIVPQLMAFSCLPILPIEQGHQYKGVVVPISVHCFSENSVLVKTEGPIDVPSACIRLEDIKPDAMHAVLVKCFCDDHFEKLLSEALVRHTDNNALQFERVMFCAKPSKKSKADDLARFIF